MSETPIYDKHKYETDLGAEVVPLEIAQKLERMLKNAEIAAETYRLEAQKAKSEQSAEMLKSERAANAILTEELDMFLAEQQAMGEIIESKDRQLAEARADADHWKSECNALQRMVHEARAEIARKDKVIEQMREALKTVVSSARPSGPLWHGSVEIEKAVAAIEAVERMKK